ncbi:UDP-N-acetylmuramate--L-alanine ligase [Leptospira borgpetersenii]|uniref:UDP-N-acetylmuramate--L-alanine ligase n=1 Tax=Leptospira borgpetersenii TaxID=174 RepID=UPI0007749838|nr:Mur ligase domain-containing protein [Leptospira borgpetersenii]MBE8401282.1 UDP-N-acetylmuramate--alanine ligase [Leptospira borgpetersenii serovar Tarassovi]MBE8404243.1 UDP-N-acetylmuramate--alanine ligase [Leptospira borgpetersenii serovar Tarassovi]MBE8407369.1 UDP-N-acetylmuramate--alanine ligase [Leptospira borgpetersenii serovar Tarassovi]MBE8413673.1 UDP-N-acetylmuramate--alanine ligase [Leptospira borgpetersenii serovar Tarassovi]MBE8416952.1 UDP-N-acetylmuramate--alanine ligase [
MKIFLIGIGGIAMGNLAYMLRKNGHEVSGSDTGIYPPMSDKLKEWNIPYFEGFKAENVQGQDLIIVGNAISRGNPEVEETLNSGLNYLSMPAAIGEFFLKGKKVIVVAGTHGKTTTTFLIHHILKENGIEPGLFVGGIRKDGFPGFELGNGSYFVIEGDEYDTAFFDKSSKFLHYRPTYAVLNALDFDHADIFPDISAIETMFKRLINLVPGNGKIFYWSGSGSLKKMIQNVKFTKVEGFEWNRKDSFLTWKKHELFLGDQKLNPVLFGDHNYRNIEVSIRVCSEILKTQNPSDYKQGIAKAIDSFPGVKRRQDILFQSSTAIVMEDFAHHPVAVHETIHAVKKRFQGHKIISLFEPRSATSHRNVFQKEYSYSFIGSDLTILTEIHNLKKVSKDIRLDVKKLVQKLLKNSKTIPVYAKDPAELLAKLEKMIPQFTGQKILILAMSNGSFGGIYPGLVELARKHV